MKVADESVTGVRRMRLAEDANSPQSSASKTNSMESRPLDQQITLPSSPIITVRGSSSKRGREDITTSSVPKANGTETLKSKRLRMSSSPTLMEANSLINRLSPSAQGKAQKAPGLKSDTSVESKDGVANSLLSRLSSSNYGEPLNMLGAYCQTL